VKVVVLDTSALIAILLQEADADRLTAVMVDADEVQISAATVMEATIVAIRLTGSALAIDRMIATHPLTVVPFDAEQLGVAQGGFARFGKGRHPAKLNFGDCFAYALAKSRDLPLLWKGDDFGLTDVDAALYESEVE
jgi:ribonuclease VapC